MIKGTTETLASRLLEAANIKTMVEDRLCRISPYFDHVGYDPSTPETLEIYCDKETPRDFTVTPEQAELILEWGFSALCFIFTDGTEQICTLEGVGIRQRSSVPLWIIEAAREQLRKHRKARRQPACIYALTFSG